MLANLTPKEIEEIHNTVLYPVVRVRTRKAGGTGVVIYSNPLPTVKDTTRPVHREGAKYETYLVTCHHVIEDAITWKEKWSDIAKRNIKVESKELVTVEVFEYEELSRCIGGTTYKGEIVTWNKEKDLAILKLRTAKRFVNVAKLYPRGKADEIKLGESMIACGCSLGHEPLFTFGNLSAKHDMIDNEEYWMTTANTVFGNSGGPVFLLKSKQYLGNSARISGVRMGFGFDVITWMGFFIPIDSIYDFFDQKYLQFLYDPSTTSKKCEALRKAKEKEEEKKLLVPGGSSPDVDSEAEVASEEP